MLMTSPPTLEMAASNASAAKRKRRPAGTPDPDAEVVALSPRTLLESDRYVCEICNQGFQRDQNLQMHRRRHKVPWKLLKRDPSLAPAAGAAAAAVKKRVFVCPESSCLHHSASHALGDLVGIKKHFRRKHSSHRQWSCGRCSKAYAVQSDYKAHLKTCGTRGHSCDCGRVFSRVESFIEHQDTCNAGRSRPPDPASPQPAACQSHTASSPSPTSADTNLSATPPTWPFPLPHQARTPELQLLPPCTTSTSRPAANTNPASDNESENVDLHLSLGPVGARPPATGQLRRAEAEKAMADEARQRARRQVEVAEAELASARRIRQQAEAELDRACKLRDHAARQISAVLLEVTCRACRRRLRPADSHVSTSVVTEEDRRDEARVSGT